MKNEKLLTKMEEFEIRTTKAKTYILENWTEDEMGEALNATMDSSIADKLEQEDSHLLVATFDSSYEEALNQIFLTGNS